MADDVRVDVKNRAVVVANLTGKDVLRGGHVGLVKVRLIVIPHY